MQVFKVSRKGRAGCDQFSAFICYAPDEGTALALNPLYPDIYHPYHSAPPRDYHLTRDYRWGHDNRDSDYWVESKEDLTLEHIGTARPDETRVGVILASYRAC